MYNQNPFDGGKKNSRKINQMEIITFAWKNIVMEFHIDCLIF